MPAIRSMPSSAAYESPASFLRNVTSTVSPSSIANAALFTSTMLSAVTAIFDANVSAGETSVVGSATVAGVSDPPGGAIGLGMRR